MIRAGGRVTLVTRTGETLRLLLKEPEPGPE
jgi:hypothetical protein